MKHTQRVNFERAFDSHVGSCVRDCACGKTYYDGLNSYDWEEGELEQLHKNKDAVELPYSVGTLYFQGKEYVMDCDCWLPSMEKFLDFMEDHGRQIVMFLKFEKERKQQVADDSPILD